MAKMNVCVEIDNNELIWRVREKLKNNDLKYLRVLCELNGARFPEDKLARIIIKEIQKWGV